ncbi:hypothetical protein CON65_10980 [Bacillus pseudomycoides]|uniref:Uncharacterized protein n=2 Tax=Bacillaceae TaxID=186817 RepID=A0AA91VEF2_9BACI|nr:hypothetical protein COO03_16870 [Bacillus sp. AFS098217]PED82625.1 hypothetical protein CON65_10980 [Bacillus pseudomycoides]PEU12085.1 hypothetical protein CN525_21390 [Bacillus sp. AFS014408]PEU17731.1 hypothetical protein CN524_01525 [Bacillus sp. AFS019443]PFW60893.1 hypothetical protein COL20_19970 [Bacillus sp. AFS075034]
MKVLQKLAKKLGYEEGEALQFFNKRICGIWLIWVGITIIAAAVVGGKYFIHPIVFLVGYFVGFKFILGSKSVRKKYSFGPMSKFQSKVSNLSIVLLFVLMGLISGRYFETYDYRMIWLGALLATGIHFIPFALVHGKSMIYLSIPLVIIALFGFIQAETPFIYIAVADGAVKVLFGIGLFLSKNPGMSNTSSHYSKNV